MRSAAVTPGARDRSRLGGGAEADRAPGQVAHEGEELAGGPGGVQIVERHARQHRRMAEAGGLPARAREPVGQRDDVEPVGERGLAEHVDEVHQGEARPRPHARDRPEAGAERARDERDAVDASERLARALVLPADVGRLRTAGVVDQGEAVHLAADHDARRGRAEVARVARAESEEAVANRLERHLEAPGRAGGGRDGRMVAHVGQRARSRRRCARTSCWSSRSRSRGRAGRSRKREDDLARLIEGARGPV